MEAVVSHWSASWPVLMGYAGRRGWHLAGLRRLPAASRAATQRAGTGQTATRGGRCSSSGCCSCCWPWSRRSGTCRPVPLGPGAAGAAARRRRPGLMVLGAPWAALRRPSGRARRASCSCSRPGVRAVPPAVVAVAAGAGSRRRERDLARLAAARPVRRGRTNAGWRWSSTSAIVAAGLVFWLQLISSRPLSQRTPPLRRLRLLIGTVVASHGAWHGAGLRLGRALPGLRQFGAPRHDACSTISSCPGPCCGWACCRR